MKKLAGICIALLLTFACKNAPNPYEQRGVIADKAMVVSAHPLASQVGIDILKEGGNAIDAMVGVHFALAVVYPGAGNIGGGGFSLYRSKDGIVSSLDFREKGPAGSSRDMYLDSLGEVIDSLSTSGHLAAGVPGSVAGMKTAHDSLGSLPWTRVVQPAIDLAREGFTLTTKESEKLNKKMPQMRAYNTRPNVFTSQKSWQPGDEIRHPDLANTLEAIRDHGRDGFYAGFVADSIVAEMQRGQGLINHQDLADYQAIWREPLSNSYQVFQIHSMAPPSSGGVALLQLLKMVEPHGISNYDWHSPEHVHLMTEAERRVYADRARHLGDADFYPVPVEGLLDETYIEGRMMDFEPKKASASANIMGGTPLPNQTEETTHYSIVDAEGNAVSVTTTLNGSYGSYVVVGGAGFVLNNEMDDFSSKPGQPNLYGLIGAEANAVAPGKRMLSSMTPTIVEKDGGLYMVVGTPGGATIITSVFQTILNVTDFGMSMQGAVSAPRFHHQWLPDTLKYEKGTFPPRVLKRLREMGHAHTTRGSIGQVDAILVMPDGRLEAGADPRGDDTAIGY